MAKRRRGHGEGTIVQRSDGRWMGQVDLGYIDGKRKRKTIYGKTRKDVAEQVRKLQTQRDQGFNIAPKRQTLAQFLEAWLRDVVEPNTRPSTSETYRKYVHLHIAPLLGNVPLDKLSARQVQGVYRILQQRGLSPTSIQRTRDVLRNALDVAVRWRLVPHNVATLVDPPRVERYEPAILTRERAQRLLAAASGDRLEALYRVALSLGLREGEILGLRWQDIDLEAGTLRVSVALQRINGTYTLVPPKTTTSQRILPLPPSLKTALHTHGARQLQERLLAGSRWREHGLVFASTVGTPLNPRNVLRSFYALLQRAGLPHMRFHDLRHSCATLLALQGVAPRTAMEILGHSNIATTMQIYTHVLDESKAEALTAVDRLFDVSDAG